MKIAVVIFLISIVSMTASLPLIGEKLPYEWFHDIKASQGKELEMNIKLWNRTVRFVGKIMLLYGLQLFVVGMFFAVIRFDPFQRNLILFMTVVFPIILGVIMTILYVGKVAKELRGELTIF